MTPEQGWSQMKTLLDREMPVEKRSRRLMAFWWSAAGIALIGLAGIFMFRSDVRLLKSNPSGPAFESSPKETMPLEENNKQENKNASVQNEFASAPPIENSNQRKSIETQPGLSSPGEPIASSDLKVGKSKIAISKKQTSKSDPSSLTVNQKPNDDPSADENKADIYSVSTPDPVNTDELISKVEILTPDERESHTTIPVQSLDIGYFTIPENELGPISASTHVDPLKYKIALRPGAEVNAISGFQGGTGLYAGAGMDAKLNSSFSITAGVGYRTFNPGVSIFSSGKEDLASDLANNGIVNTDMVYDQYPVYVASESLTGASYSDLDPVVESLNQWQTQLGIEWNVSGRFSLEGGVAVSFHTQAYSEYPILSSGFVANPTSKVSHALNEYDVIRSTMTSVYAGIGYHIGRHLAVKMQWLHTGQPYLTTNNGGASASVKQRDDFIRGITVGMKYSFL